MKMLSLAAVVLLAASLAQAQATGVVDTFSGTGVNTGVWTLPTYGTMAANTSVSDGYLNLPLSSTWGNAAGAGISVPVPAGNYIATAKVHFNPLTFANPADPGSPQGYIAGAGMFIASANYNTEMGIENVKEMSAANGGDPFITSTPNVYTYAGLAMYPKVAGGYFNDTSFNCSSGRTTNGFNLLRNDAGYGLYSTSGDGVQPTWNCITGDLYFRIAKVGNIDGTSTYNFSVSGDGATFTSVQTITSDALWDPITQVGLCNSGPAVVGFSQFDDFQLSPLVISGDANHNGIVDMADYQAWFNNYGTGTTFEQGNFKVNGVTDVADYMAWRNNYGSINLYASSGGAAAPEPITLALLGLGGLALLRRKK